MMRKDSGDPKRAGAAGKQAGKPPVKQPPKQQGGRPRPEKLEGPPKKRSFGRPAIGKPKGKRPRQKPKGWEEKRAAEAAAKAAALAARPKAKPKPKPPAEAPAKPEPDLLADALRALDSPDRNIKIPAIFQIGQALASADLEAADVKKVVAKLEALVADREAGHWVRKRAKRALKKIRGEGGGDGDAEAGDAESTETEAGDAT